MKKWLGLGLTAMAIVAALAAPWLTTHDPLLADFVASLKPPGTPGHPLGTDQLGRDLLARVLFGARLALFIGVCTVVVTAVVGGLLGLVAGFVERWPSAVLDVLGEDYIKTARAKGLGEARVIGKHTLRNSAIPIVTLAALEAGQLLGGAVVTETIFAWPGLGRLTVQALLNRDFPVVMAAVSFTSIVYTLMNLGVDLAYGWLDPRVRIRP